MLKVLGIVAAVLAALLAAAWLALRGPDIPYATLEARYAGTKSGYLDASGGLRLHYQASGPAGTPPIVLLHGFGDSFTSWDQWLPVLATEYRVITLDLPGHGLTRAPEGYVLNGAGMVAAVDALASGLDLPRFALAGNSMGGGVAWHYALAHPERLSALILVDAAGWPLPPPDKLPLAFRILRYSAGRWLLAHIDNRPLIQDGLRKNVYDPSVITPALIDRWAEFQRAPGHRAILMSADFRALGDASAETLAAIRVPTLVLHGEVDPLIPLDAGRRFASAIPGARLITYPKVGHLPQIENPARSAADVAAFLRDAAAPRAP